MILRLRELSKEYVRGGVRFPAVDRVSLEVEAGGYVSIVGRSGSGKSTLPDVGLEVGLTWGCIPGPWDCDLN